MNYSTIKVSGNVIIKKGVIIKGNVKVASKVGGITYASLSDKPQINFKTLESGNNTYDELGLEPTIIDITEQDIDNMLYGG